MLNHAMLALEPLSAFNAIELSKTWEILCWLGRFVIGQVFGGA